MAGGCRFLRTPQREAFDRLRQPGLVLVAFYWKRVGGTPVFAAAVVAEALVVACFLFTEISFLWYNVVGCVAVIVTANLLAMLRNEKTPAAGAAAQA